MSAGAEVLDGLWQFTAIHPEWDEEDADWDGPEVAWWAIQTERGLLLVDPLVDDWEALDELIEHGGGCAAVVRTCYWHARSVPAAADRYATDVWARPAPPGVVSLPLHRAVETGVPLPGDVLPFETPRDDEIALWSGPQRALIFGDVMVRSGDGELRCCPDSWLSRSGGPEPLRAALRELLDLPVEHVLVAHGPLVLGDGADALAGAVSDQRAT